MHEYDVVKSRAGLFTMQHKAVVRLAGADAGALVERLLCGDVRRLPVGQERFSPMLNYQGGIMDAVQALHPSPERYWLILNRVCHEKDLRHIRREAEGNVEIFDLDGEVSLLLLLGPAAAGFLGSEPAEGELIIETDVCGVRCMSCRMPRLGVDGFFLVCAAQDEDRLIAAMNAENVPLCAPDVLDVFMLEAGMPSYGREMDDTLNPLETGLKSRVNLNRPGFVGREALVAAGEPRRTLIGLVLDKFGAGYNMPLVHRDKYVGYITSARYCPGIEGYAALALIETPYQDVGRKLKVETPDGMIDAVVAKLPLQKETEEEAGEL